MLLLLLGSQSRGATRDREGCQPVVHFREMEARKWSMLLHRWLLWWPLSRSWKWLRRR